jgi:iron(III) transport system substrate-binding protein
MRGLYGRGLLGVLSVFISISSADAAPTLTIYSARHYDTDTQLFAQFEAQTGATIRVLTAGDDELIERLRAEGVRTPADVLLTVDAGRLWRAAQAGLYQPVDSPTLNQRIPAHLRDTEGQWFGFSVRARVIAYPLAKGVPEGISRYDDLVGPAAKGKVCVRSSSNIYNQSLLAALIAHDGVEAATAWAQGLVANMARPPQGNDTAQLEAVARGECDLALVNSYYLLRLQDEGKMLGLGMLFPNQADRGTHINISGGGVIKHSQN